MSTRRFGLWAGAGVLALASVAALAASGGNEGRPADAGKRFLHIGDFYLNASKIDYAERHGDHLVIVFGSEAGTRLELSGSDAESMRLWLEDRQPASIQTPNMNDHEGNIIVKPDCPASKKKHPQAKSHGGDPTSRRRDSVCPE